jgi:hypothetical protein
MLVVCAFRVDAQNGSSAPRMDQQFSFMRWNLYGRRSEVYAYTATDRSASVGLLAGGRK